MTDSQKQDLEQLKLLSLFHYIMAGLTALVALFPIVHLIIGIIFIVAPESMESNGEAPPVFFGWLFVIFASVFILAGWILAIFILVAGRKLAHRRSRIFCIVVAAIECMFFPLGTALGVFTIVVLMRESVIELFEVHSDSIQPKISDEFEDSF